MSGLLTLSVITPLSVAVETTGIASLRAEDASGGFGIQPGHADFITVIDAGVLRWRSPSEAWRYCAVRGGVFTVSRGQNVRVTCRDAVTDDDLATLEDKVATTRRARVNAERQTRTRSAQLHARAIRRLMRGLSPGEDILGMDGEEDGT